jgi:coproporphyrinogen III oxidase-like Fe-S oxidoreductase
MPQQRIKQQDLPTPKDKLAVLEDSILLLTQAGYHYVGMGHFAKPNDSLARAQIPENYIVIFRVIPPTKTAMYYTAR